MAAGDFADLQLNLARLSGFDTAAELARDLYLAKQCINEVYLECYAPNDDGVRPPWAVLSKGIQFAAPVTTTIGVTQGSTTFTGYSPSATKIGSIVQIGSNFYTYAGSTGGSQKFVEPVLESTGSLSATFFHNSYPLDASIVQVLKAPELIGVGPLSPFLDRHEMLAYRACFRGDFVPEAGGGYDPSPSWSWSGTTYNSGQPEFYLATGATLLTDAAYACRFVVYPLPDRLCDVFLQAHYLPTSLDADADVPRMPAAKVIEILLPLVREKWALEYHRYTGENIDRLVNAANRARRHLQDFATEQADRPQQIRARYTE